MRYRFTTVWAFFLIIQGAAFLAAGLLLGIAALSVDFRYFAFLSIATAEQWWVRAAAAVVAVMAGVLLGGPLIVAGQLLLVFLDQRRLLSAIHRRMRRWEEEYADKQMGPPLGRRRGSL